MKSTTIFGVVLLVLGFALLVNNGFTFTRREKVLEIGPIKATADRTETLPVPPLLAWAISGTGLALLVLGARSART